MRARDIGDSLRPEKQKPPEGGFAADKRVAYASFVRRKLAQANFSLMRADLPERSRRKYSLARRTSPRRLTSMLEISGL